MLTQEAVAVDALVSQAEAARQLGVSRQAVHKAVKTGRLHAEQDGRISLRDALLLWKTSRDPQAELREEVQAAGESSAYRDEKAAHERVKREIAQHELERLRDQYRDKGEVEAAMTTCGRRLRDAMARAVEDLAGPLAAQFGLDHAAARAWLRSRVPGLQQVLAASLTEAVDERAAA